MELDNQGSLAHWEDMRETLKEGLKGLSFEETLEQWNTWTEFFKTHENGRLYPDFFRSMVMCDRYFLLVNVIFAEKDRHFILHPWLFERCREVERDRDNHLDAWARGHCKTTIITEAGSIQEVLNDPNISIAIFSFTKQAAIKILGNIKRHLQNPILINLFPDILYEKPERDAETWTKERIIVKRQVNLREGTIDAAGVVIGQPTGAHYRLRVYDDLVTAESVSTPEQIAKTTEMLDLSDNLGMKGGRVWFIGTRYALGDTYQTMMDRGQVIPRIHPATDDGTMDGNPVFLTKEEWADKKKSQDLATICCQLLQNPNAGSRAMFNLAGLKNSFYIKRPSLLNVYILVDPATTKKKGSDKTAIAVVGVDSNYNKFLLDGFHHRMGLNEKWICLRGLYRQWVNAIGVMDVKVGYETYGPQSDIEYMHEQMEKEGSSFEITPLSGKMSKIDRMARLEPDIRNGRLWLPKVVTSQGKYTEIKIEVDELTKEPKLVKRALSDERIKANGAILSDPLAVRPLRRKDENGKIYDMTLDFLDQARQVPNNSSHDDLIDAMSRIYDMDILAPRVYARSGLMQPDFLD